MTGAESLLRRFTVVCICMVIIVTSLYAVMWLFRLMDAMR